MDTNIRDEVDRLGAMSPAALRERYLALFGEPSRSGNKRFLIKRIAWRIQSLAEGTLSERAKRRAEELARDVDLRTTIPRSRSGGDVPSVVIPAPAPSGRLPIPGTLITRQYQGRSINVTVLPKGFEYQGEIYRSLSAVAKAVTGSHWNGYLFFGITPRSGAGGAGGT